MYTTAFKGKNVLVTGASKGIGAAIARHFAQHGATVALHFSNSHASAESVLGQMEGSGHVLLRQDFSQVQAAEKLMKKYFETYSKLDILVNNAGIARLHPPTEVGFAEWQKAWSDIIQINLTVPADLCFLATKNMKKSGGGRIINITSRGAFRGEPDMPAYGASKAALNSLTQSLAKAFAKENIYCTAVAPGFTETDMARATLNAQSEKQLLAENPMGRFASPEEVAAAVLFLASEKAAYCNGTIIDVNGASYLR